MAQSYEIGPAVGFLAVRDSPVGKVRTVHLALLAQLDQQLDRFHRIPPLVVSARVVPVKVVK